VWSALAERHLNRARAEYYELGTLDRVIEDCTKAIDLDPTIVACYGCRGAAHFVHGCRTQALEDCATAITLDANCFPAFFLRGLIHAYWREFDEAIQQFTEVIRLNPKHASSYLHRALACSDRDDDPETIEPDFETVKILGEEGERLSKDDRIAKLSEAIRLDPDQPDAYFQRASYYELRARFYLRTGTAVPRSTAQSLKAMAETDYTRAYADRARGREFAGRGAM
jgi:tetratricopeptide (TPR) repeat protein